MVNRARLFTLVRIVALAVVPLLAGAFLQGCTARGDKDDEDQARKTGGAAAPAGITVQNGRIILTLDAPSQKRLGLGTVALSESYVRLQLSVPAVVLSAQDLTNLCNGYVSAQAQLQKTQANLGVATKEYRRLKNLYQDNQNASAKALEAAEGTMQGDKADENAAQQQLDLQASLVRQQWGTAVAGWVSGNTAALERVLAQRDMLVQVTIPPDNTVSPPPAISLDVAGGQHLPASFVSAFPRVDPRIQGHAFLYITAARSGVIPGMNLIAHLATGKPMRGFVVPESAVVWSEGQAWIYRQFAANQFSRFVAATDTPVQKGFLVTKGLSEGDRVVVRGAQALLSEELLLQGQGASAPDTDTD
jgi:hypothetical protein